MSIRPYASRRLLQPLRVEMTPMIDVVFLLLIFFLWTASFRIAEQRLPSSVAETRDSRGTTTVTADRTDFEPIVIGVDWQGGALAWTVNGRVHPSLDSISDTLSAVVAVQADVPVVVDPTPLVPLGHVIDLYDLTRRVGFDQVQFAAEQPSAEGAQRG